MSGPREAASLGLNRLKLATRRDKSPGEPYGVEQHIADSAASGISWALLFEQKQLSLIELNSSV